MPLTTNETKALLVQMFRLTLATAQQRHEDAVAAFSSILDSALTQRPDLNTCCADISSINGDSDDEMPPLVPLATPVQLIISETAQSPVVASASSAFTPIAQNVVGSAFNMGPQDIASVASDSEPEVEEASDMEEDEDEAASGSEAGEAEEEAEAEEAEEEVELDLEPVRIKKVMYWKDVNSGDIYTYIPEDEGVGDKVGTYVDGKPVFDA